MITVKRLPVEELGILTKLFKYNDVDSMLRENTEMICSGIMDIFCISKEGNPIGELRVKYVSDEELYTIKGSRAYLYAFRINSEFRGRGYGKQLMKYVIDTLENEGYSEFTIGVGDENKRAKHIYESFGFNKVIARRTETYQGDTYSYTLYLKS